MKRLATPESVSNPGDFINTKVPELADLDSLLRCHICKDFLTTSVLTPCGHSFCSVCIRKYLQTESKCPVCLSDLTESMLQKEYLVQEICASYVKLRESLLHHLALPSESDKEVQQALLASNDEPAVITQRKRTPETFTSSGQAHKKRKRDVITSMLKRTPTLSREKTAQCPICLEHLPLSELEGPHIDVCLNKQAAVERSDSFEIIDEISIPNQETDSAKAKKGTPSLEPVRADNAALSYHKDRYLNSGQQQRKENRLPRLDYQSLSNSQLKQKLTALGLSSTGTKQQMVARYKHYEMLWNSNFLDSIDPVDESELKRRLSSWDGKHNSDHTQRDNSITSLLRGSRRTNQVESMLRLFKTDRFDRKGWIRYHSTSFKELKAEALAARKRARLKMTDESHLNQDADAFSETQQQEPIESNRTSGLNSQSDGNNGD